jgi:superfamily II DNA or RNA helicase
VLGTKFVVAMIHSLSKPGKYPDWIGDTFGLVIFDECHRLPAEQFRAVASMFAARLRLGLSATPDRSDGKELLLYAHVGPVRVRTSVQLLVPKVLRYRTGWQCPRRYVTDPDSGERVIERIPHEAGQTTFMEKILAADEKRNLEIALILQTVHDRGRRIVVFSTLHDHLHSLLRAAKKVGISGKEMGLYIGAQTKAEKEARDRATAKPVIFTTFGMMGEGTDIPWLDTCLLAMPRANVVQPVGRIRREYEGKPEPRVIDLIDPDSPVFVGYAVRRLAWYRRIGAEVKDMT